MKEQTLPSIENRAFSLKRGSEFFASPVFDERRLMLKEFRQEQQA
jgi:hypothetical protein